MHLIFFLFFSILVLFSSCQKDDASYATENIIVIVVDGARYSEFFGDTTYKNIPYFSNYISGSGIINTNFYNNGPTYTCSGFTSITTGFYQEIDNSGRQFPVYPSIFQYFIKQDTINNKNTWIVNSKDKLAILGNCQEIDYKDFYLPLLDCGIDGIASGYRDDSVTFNNSLNILSQEYPKLLLVGFKEPDAAGHTGVWEDYLQAIRTTDRYIYKIWEYIQNNPHYSGKTTIFITSDHGRHLDDIHDGFPSHGDSCEGCRHVFLFASGPDFKKGVINVRRGLIDISATIGELLGFEVQYGDGTVMYELFK